jgi:ribonuclease VapC
MILDSSALAAILIGEEDGLSLPTALSKASARRMSAANFLETSIIMYGRRGESAVRNLDIYVNKARIALIPVTEHQARFARDAYIKFGKGHHPASLNFGDCFAYALARETGSPLLCKESDFAKTDANLASY